MKKRMDRGRLEPNGGSPSNKIYLLGQRDLFSCVFRNWQFKKIYMYVQIIIFLYMIISLKSRIYLTGWNEGIGGRRVGAGRDLSRVVFSYILPIDFRAFSRLSSRRFGRRVRRVIPAVVATPKPTVRFHVHFRNAHRYSISGSLHGAHYSAALVILRVPL